MEERDRARPPLFLLLCLHEAFSHRWVLHSDTAQRSRIVDEFLRPLSPIPGRVSLLRQQRPEPSLSLPSIGFQRAEFNVIARQVLAVRPCMPLPHQLCIDVQVANKDVRNHAFIAVLSERLDLDGFDITSFVRAAFASLPHGCPRSGVSTPFMRTRTRPLASCTSIVSPSTTQITVPVRTAPSAWAMHPEISSAIVSS